MKKHLFAFLIVSLVFASFAMAAVQYGGTLKVVMPWGQLSLNNNPFLPTSQTLEMQNLIYEPLFYINSVTGKIVPILGTSYKWEDNNLKLVVSVRRGVEWSDGTDFTANDVAFTFNYIKANPGLDTSGLWAKNSYLQSVVASGDTVIFAFSRPNTPMFTYIAQTLIVPEHIWSSIKDPSKYTNGTPIGTGPFLFKSFSSGTNSIDLTKNPDYWMKGKPYIDGIQVQSVNSNTTALLYMLRHEYDWSYIYVPDVEKAWIGKDSQDNKMWWPINGLVAFYMNTMNPPFDNSTFRKALSMAIDKESLNQKAYYGIPGVANPTGMTSSQTGEWFDPTLSGLAKQLNTYDPKEALRLLETIGYKLNGEGKLIGPDGKPLPDFKIAVVSGWTDYITMAQVISTDLRKIGIQTTIDQLSFGSWWSTLTTGQYEMCVAWGTGFGPTPYYLFNQEFNPSFSATKVGETAASDWSRYTNPLITSALDVYSQTSDKSLQKQSLYTIERIMLEDVPYIPLVYSTSFDLFYSGKFAGFPSKSDPYAAGAGIGSAEGLLVTTNVHLK